MNLARAERLANLSHKHQTYNGGSYFHNHILEVVRNVATKTENVETVIIAFLHDIVEDTDVTLEDLKEAGFSEFVLNGVDTLTKRKGETYYNYISRVIASRNPEYKRVKLADLEVNLANGHTLDNWEILEGKWSSAKKRVVKSL